MTLICEIPTNCRNHFCEPIQVYQNKHCISIIDMTKMDILIEAYGELNENW